MGKLFSITATALSACLLLTACGNDDAPIGNNQDGDNNNPQTVIDVNRVFTDALPQSVGDIRSITYTQYATGTLVTGMTTQDGGSVSFEYANIKTRIDKSPVVRMSIEEKDEKSVIDMHLGPDGFVREATEYTSSTKGDSQERWAFNYNADGQLCRMERSEGGWETTTITYQDGDIAKVKMHSEADDEYHTYTIGYVSPSSERPTPADNKGCIMMFDATLGIDMDEMQYAYYAGLLGKATRHLPMTLREGKEQACYDWTLNAKGYPTLLKTPDKSYRFGWNQQ